MDSHEHRLKALGDYLKSRRSRLTPSITGLPDGQLKRRMAGLKREEVALLAGVSTTWYTWLEQGRDINVSKQVLQSIARALRLNNNEYLHMLHLAQLSAPDLTSLTINPLPSSLQKILDDLSHPAMIVNNRSDVLAWNLSSCEYFTDFAKVPLHERNMTWQFFAYKSLRCRITNWEECANYAVAVFRVFCDRNAGDCTLV
jgi:transcriptional regulator with XRE-family HTH domain